MGQETVNLFPDSKKRTFAWHRAAILPGLFIKTDPLTVR